EPAPAREAACAAAAPGWQYCTPARPAAGRTEEDEMRPERFEEGAAVPGEARRGSGDAARPVRSSGWARWTPVAAPLWSLGYGLAALYWALSGQGFPYAGAKGAAMGPLAAGFGAGPAWAPVIAVGLPAAVLGALMLRRPRRGRRTLVGGGAAAAVLLLVCM